MVCTGGAFSTGSADLERGSGADGVFLEIGRTVVTTGLLLYSLGCGLAAC
jgi:hypothetical protein